MNERSVGVLHRLLGASWRGGLEAVAVIVDGRQQALVRLVVVAEDGHASTARADELDLYGVIEDNYADPQTEPPSARLG